MVQKLLDSKVRGVYEGEGFSQCSAVTIDLQGQYGFSTSLQVLQDLGEGGKTISQAPAPSPAPGEGGLVIRRLIAKIGLGEGGIAIA